MSISESGEPTLPTGHRAQPGTQPGTQPGKQGRTRPRYGWLSTTVALVFGVLFVFVLFTAISNVVGVTEQINAYNKQRIAFNLAAVPTPWFWLVANLLAAPVFFAAAFWLGLRRSIVVRFVLLLVAFAALSAVTLTITALV